MVSIIVGVDGDYGLWYIVHLINYCHLNPTFDKKKVSAVSSLIIK